MRLRLAVLQPGGTGLGVTRELARGVEADLLLLPENWLAPRPIPLSEYLEASTALASMVGAPVLAGSQYVIAEGEAQSLGVIAFPDGSYEIVCGKAFPSASIGERGRISPTPLGRPFEVSGIAFACIVCVDIYYPEISRYMALRGAEVIVNPASIPWNRVWSWRAVLSARAAENIIYTIGVNKTGTAYPDGRVTGGHSAVYAPDGEPLASLGPHPGVLHATIDTGARRVVLERRRFLDDARALEARGLYNWGALHNRTI
ncbi:MAG: carbon-nitrogen hydrolase family protein [Desulfurococcales archaeon]|nr:carbon-nitrogen hydrolase family protein [Desulfurococcales archaeon]